MTFVSSFQPFVFVSEEHWNERERERVVLMFVSSIERIKMIKTELLIDIYF
jgi:hypothetical protein